ncbi:bifunctional DNA primase/polymerase [Streptomyces sp. PT12]|uniref:bifunctional DNA primase/polymerase n=1 Tax=Streptomyces sp. PT12 TaxID=1510197 RepID=UPI000DE40997|nr:bifunctional DNA primase/polymerase [Streptomyces sp. PT12]RBM17744.1 DNA primase [Streptomyces sp. PT12]
MEDTIGTTSGAFLPARGGRHGGNLLEYAVHYVRDRHWEVLPGAWIEREGRAASCSCRAWECGAPGAHPVRRDWEAHATGSVTVARRMWSERPRASILLPTGRTFDVIEVPEAAGCLALARMERLGVALGPVAGTPYGRMQFYVLPGGAAKVAGLVRRLGWSPAALDLTARGEGDIVAAPPTSLGPRGRVLWVRAAGAGNGPLPGVEDVLPSLAYACGQEGGPLA